uniref:Uncharacterized protein n=1 Tax=Parascaris equorum TaxID=6256 RepID=A0A914R7D4_PAREQ
MVVEEGTRIRSLVGEDRRSAIAKLSSYIEQVRRLFLFKIALSHILQEDGCITLVTMPYFSGPLFSSFVCPDLC